MESETVALPKLDKTSQSPIMLPHNIEAEQGLLGCLLIDNRQLDHVSDFLLPDHFFYPSHARIYEAIFNLVQRGQIASPVILKGSFEKAEDLEKVGGAVYLADLAASVINLNGTNDYARIIYDLYLARQLITQCEDTARSAYDISFEENIRDVIETHEASLFSLVEHGSVHNEVTSFHESMQVALKMAEAAFTREGQVSGVATGFTDLDNILGGLHPTDFVILAGRPSMGKTALATNIGFNAAKTYLETGGRAGAKVGFFSLEMGHAQITTRILGGLAGISSDAIRKGHIQEHDFRQFTAVGQQYKDLPLYIDSTTSLTIGALQSRARRLKRKYNVDLIIVDYLQLLFGSPNRRSSQNRVQEVSEITRGLKAIAKDLDLPVLALSQLSRNVESREDKRPLLSDLRDSGSLEQDADVVMFVYRDEYYLSREEPSQRATESGSEFTTRRSDWEDRMRVSANKTDILISKQRHGPIGTVSLYFDPNYTQFSDLAA